MSPLHLLCALLISCEPLQPVPVPMQEIEPAGLPATTPDQPAAKDTGHKPVLDVNRAPVILSIELEPAAPRTLDDIEVRVKAEDPDRDYIRYEYTWLVNQQELRGLRQPKLSHTNFAKGDMVQLKVVATDRDLETEGLSPVLVVRNTPPEIVSQAGSLRSIDGYRVQAQDIDGDPLSFRLEGQPDGMSIDGSSGKLSYSGSETAKAGAYQVQVIVEDPDKGSAKWSFGITVAAGSVGTQAAASQEQSPKRKRGYQPGDNAVEPEEEE